MSNSSHRANAGDDIFSTTTRISKAVTSTASALIGNNSSSNSNNILLNSTHYQKAIYDTLIGPSKLRQKDQGAVSTSYGKGKKKEKVPPSEFLRLHFSKDDISYRAITHIPDDLLNEIPDGTELDQSGKYSLFQGFNAAIPQVDEELYIFKELNLDDLKFSPNNQKLLTLEDDKDGKNRILIEKKLNNPLPIDISSKKIKKSKSVKNLNFYKQKILKKMHYLEVKKDLSSNEIKEIDTKIQRLTSMRDSIFQKVAKIEKDEIYLENYIQEISDKIKTLDNGGGNDVGGGHEESESNDDEDQLPSVPKNSSSSKHPKSNNNHSRSASAAKHSRRTSKSYAKGDKISFEKDEVNQLRKYQQQHKSPLQESIAQLNHTTHSNTFTNGNASSSSEDYALVDDDESEDQGPLLSQSIYTSLQKKPPKFHKISSKDRKIKPTLQNYYSSGTQISSFMAHDQALTCFDFDYPFGTMVSASLDGTVRVWDLSTQKCLTLLEGHDMYVRCMQMDDNLLVTGSEDSNLKLWDLSKVQNKEYEIDEDEEDPVIVDSTNEGAAKANDNDSEPDLSDPCVYTFESHIDEITALHFDNSNLISGSSDRTIRQWDMTTGHCLQTLDVLWVTNPATLPMDASVSIPAFPGSSFIHSTNTTTVPHSTNAPFISALQCYSAALASGTADGIVRLWDLRSGEVIRSLTGHTGPVTSLQFDDQSLITGSLDKSIKIWDLRMGKIQKNLVYDAPVQNLQFDSKRIVFTNGKRFVNVYDRVTEEVTHLLPKEDQDEPAGETEGDNRVVKSAVAKYARYKEGYLVGGFSDGIVKTWAV